MASAGYCVLDVSLEDADELTAHRFIAGCTGLNYGKIAAQELTEDDRDKLVLPEAALSSAENVILAGEIFPSIDEIIRTARFYKYKRNLAAVVIDYVQLLESKNPRHSEKERLDEIMRKCQLAAKRDNIAYVIVSQVKQDVDQRTNHRPRITDMIGSSAMRTASKLSIGVYRPGLYDLIPKKGSGYENLFHNHPQGVTTYRNMLELHFLKNVLGQPRVVVHCLVTPETGQIEPFDMRSWT
jgi:replicative DNA helicase